METQFHKTVYPHLSQVIYQVQDQEQTMELRLPEGLPDIGRILGVWGQPLVRSKEWQSDSMRVNCGVMAWVMYAPEDGSSPRCAQAWIPFQQSFSHNEGNRDATVQVQCLLRSIDGRTLSARKLMLRAVINILAQAWVDAETDIYAPCELPADICLLQNTYPIRVLKEAGEKPFVMDEELTMPSASPELQNIIRYDMRCELIDKKVLTDKVVFRGVGVLHILYLGADGGLHNCNLDIPISQYGNLNGEYAEDAAAEIEIALTGLELDYDTEGRLRLKSGLTGQYRIYTNDKIALAQDVYSPKRTVTPQLQELKIPAVLDKRCVSVPVQQNISNEVGRIVDTAFYPDQPRCEREQDKVRTVLSGVFHILRMDTEGQLQPMQLRWQTEQMLEAAPESVVQMSVNVSGTPVLSETADGLYMSCDLLLDQETLANRGIPMLTGMEMGAEQEPDPQRPSLILRRAGENSLWELAKENGSTVDAICRANDITDDADLGQQMLLIPVC